MRLPGRSRTANPSPRSKAGVAALRADASCARDRPRRGFAGASASVLRTVGGRLPRRRASHRSPGREARPASGSALARRPRCSPRRNPHRPRGEPPRLRHRHRHGASAAFAACARSTKASGLLPGAPAVLPVSSPCAARADHEHRTGNPVQTLRLSPGAARVRAQVRPPLPGARAHAVDSAVVGADDQRVAIPIIDTAVSNP